MTDTRLPEYGSEEFIALARKLSGAAEHGDIATLEQVGAVTIFHIERLLILCALQAGRADVVAWLVQESERTGVDIAFRWKALHVAALQGKLDKLKAATNEELALKAGDKETVLHCAAMGDQGEAIEYLVRERGLDVHSPNATGRSVLEVASQRGSVSAIDALVACGGRLSDQPGKAAKALVTAARYGQVAAMETLVQHGADISVVDRSGGVVHAAARCGREEVIECAVRLGADPRAVDRLGRTALHIAVLQDQPGAMRRLVHVGVHLDAVDNAGRTALHTALTFPGACRVLLELGADRWLKDAQDRTARDRAASEQFQIDEAEQVVELLDTFWPIMPSMAQLLLGLRGPSESPLTRFAAHSAFEPRVLSLINCLLTGKDDKAYDELYKLL